LLARRTGQFAFLCVSRKIHGWLTTVGPASTRARLAFVGCGVFHSSLFFFMLFLFFAVWIVAPATGQAFAFGGGGCGWDGEDRRGQSNIIYSSQYDRASFYCSSLQQTEGVGRALPLL